MNIIILSDRYHPAPVSGAVMIYDLAREFSEKNHNVFVLTADSNIDSFSSITKESGVNILRVKAKNQKKLSKPFRLLFELFLQRKIWRVFKSKEIDIEFDLIIAHSPTIFWSYLLKKLKEKNKSAKSYLILRDIFPKWALDTGIISFYNPIYWFLKWHEKKLYEQVQVIGVQSKSNLNYFESNVHKLGLEVLYNFKKINFEKINKSNIREDLSLQKKVIFVFGGNLGFAQDINNILELVDAFKNNSKIHFLIIGEGTEYKNIESWIEREKRNNCHLLPAVSDLEYQSILKECDVGIISLRSSFKTDNFPNKILNYMQYELPILASVNSRNELIHIIRKNYSGLASINGNKEDLINNTKELLDDANLRKKMGQNGKNLLREKFNSIHAIESILRSIS